MMLTSSPVAARRRGIVLLVVLAMLTLFATVAVAFVYFSEGTVTEMTLRKESETISRPDPELLFAYALGQLVHDTSRPNSSLRTHSLINNMYGATGHMPYSGIGRVNRNVVPVLDGLPDSELWRWLGPLPAPFPPHVANNKYLINYAGRAYNEVYHGSFNPNYTYPDHDNAFLGSFTADGIVTARSFVRTVTPPLPPNNNVGAIEYPSGFNPYDPFSARQLSTVPPSPDSTWWTFWSSTAGSPMGFGPLPVEIKKAMVVRPGPWDAASVPVLNATDPNFVLTEASAFPIPEDLGGDVKNLPPGFRTFVGIDPVTSQPVFANNDSYWVDLDFPIQVDQATGRKYKPLFAFFIAALDGKVNLNVAGNMRGQMRFAPVGAFNRNQASQHGLGPWEINPSYVSANQGGAGFLQTAPFLQEWLHLFGGTAVGGPANPLYPGIQSEHGRYGYDLANVFTNPATPFLPAIATTLLPQDRPSNIYHQYTLDGTRQAAGNYLAALPYLPPVLNPTDPRVPDPHGLSYDRHPRFASRSGVYWGWDSTTSLLAMLQRPLQLTNHPLYFNPYWGPFGTNRLLGPWMMEALLRHGDTGTDALAADLRRIMPLNSNNPAFRRSVTTISNDPNRTGPPPCFRQLEPGEPPIGPFLNTFLQFGAPVGTLPPAAPFPSGNGIPAPPSAAPPAPAQDNDYWLGTWKSTLGELLKLDLNRPLPAYPLPRPDPGNPARLVIDSSNAAILAAFAQARLTRQEFARDIYQRLILVTGAVNPFGVVAVTPSAAELNALRYLAQLAVNIVDYVDNDGHTYSTPFNWGSQARLPENAAFVAAYNGEWVFGTKQPRVVLNEAYIESTGSGPAYRVYVELCNPMKAGAREYLCNPAGTLPATAPAIYGIYQIHVAKRQPNMHLRQLNNVTGEPFLDPTPDQPAPVDFTDLPGTLGTNPGDNTNYFIDPLEDRYRGPDGSADPDLGDPNAANRGFYVAGPPVPLAGPAGPGDPHVPVVSYQTMNLSCTRNGGGALLSEPPTLLLRRLAVPFLPPDLDPTSPTFNPYITVDYVEEVPVNQNTLPVTQRRSFGKSQPFAGRPGTWRLQSPHITPGPLTPEVGVGPGLTAPNTPIVTTPLNNQPQTTFFRHNSLEEVVVTLPLNNPANGLPTGATPLPEPRFLNQTLDLPFTWLPQLERHLLTPTELLGVSGFKPHELTQTFLGLMTFSLANIAAGPDQVVQVENVISAPGAGLILGITHGQRWSIAPGDILSIGHGASHERVVVKTVTSPTFTADFLQAHNGSAIGMPSNVPNGVIVGHVKNGQTPPWFNTSARLYRFMEMVETRHRMAGLSAVAFEATPNPIPSSGAVLPTPPFPAQTLTVPIVTTITPGPTYNALGLATGGARYAITPGATVILDPGQINEEVVRVQAVNPLTGAFTCVVQKAHDAGPVVVQVPAVGGIHPGKVNVNLIQDLQTFMAVADPQPGNAFNPTLGLIDQTGGTPGSLTFISPTRMQWNNVWPPPPLFAGMPYNPLGLTTIQPGMDLLIGDPHHYRQRVRIVTVAQNGASTLIDFDPPLTALPPPPAGPANAAPICVDVLPTLYNSLVQSREGMSAVPYPVQDGRPTQDGTLVSRPIRSLASGFVPNPGGMTTQPQQYPFGAGLSDTVLRDREGDGLSRTLWELGRPSDTAEFRNHELLLKLTNNLTTRSNTFAVWCTVGYFEVLPTDPVTRTVVPEGTPGAVYRLGAEIGRMDGRHKRHRFFAIVDRATIDTWVQQQGPFYSVDGGVVPGGAGAPFALLSNPLIDPRKPTDAVLLNFPTAVGMGTVVPLGPVAAPPPGVVLGQWLFVEDGDNSEWVVVEPDLPPPATTQLQIVVRKPHPNGFRVRSIVPPSVVHWSVIE